MSDEVAAKVDAAESASREKDAEADAAVPAGAQAVPGSAPQTPPARSVAEREDAPEAASRDEEDPSTERKDNETGRSLARGNTATNEGYAELTEEQKRTVYLGDITGSFKREDIERMFKDCGTIEHIDPKGNYAFVRFSTLAEAERALGLHRTQQKGRTVTVHRSKSRAKAAGAHTCFHCGRDGHWARACPLKLAQQQAATVPGQPQGQQQGSGSGRRKRRRGGRRHRRKNGRDRSRSRSPSPHSKRSSPPRPTRSPLPYARERLVDYPPLDPYYAPPVAYYREDPYDRRDYIPADYRDLRDMREVRDLRLDARDARDVRDLRDIRDLRDLRDIRDYRDIRDIHDVRDPYYLPRRDPLPYGYRGRSRSPGRGYAQPSGRYSPRRSRSPPRRRYSPSPRRY